MSGLLVEEPFKRLTPEVSLNQLINVPYANSEHWADCTKEDRFNSWAREIRLVGLGVPAIGLGRASKL